MPDGIPDGITREEVIQAIADFDAGAAHDFRESTGYDLVRNGKPYPPKAIIGLAARRAAGRTLTPYDFKGGEGSRCFRILRDLGFEIFPKEKTDATPIPFVVGQNYTREDIYEILKVPEERRRGNWETGYTRWGNDLYMFPTVGSAATGGYDYDNGWEGDIFRWYAKESTRLDQPQIQWILTEAERIFIFTRPAVRNPFKFEGLGSVVSWEDVTPVLIRWKIGLPNSEATFTTLPTEVSAPAKYVEGATRVVSVNAYERNPSARRACVDHFGFTCGVCGFCFRTFYGEIGEGFIHVHHLRDLSTVGGEYEVDPIKDLRPVCPNCHAMLHTETPAMSIERLKEIIVGRHK